MACPKCGCKVTYPYGSSDILEKCAHCGKVFDNELEGMDDEEDDYEDVGL